ncbi:zinc finger, CCHC-type containing protein [Tanacetum coccineum]
MNNIPKDGDGLENRLVSPHHLPITVNAMSNVMTHAEYMSDEFFLHLDNIWRKYSDGAHLEKEEDKRIRLRDFTPNLLMADTYSVVERASHAIKARRRDLYSDDIGKLDDGSGPIKLLLVRSAGEAHLEELGYDLSLTRFLAQFFPLGRTAKLQKDILMFQQYQDESLYYAWTRFKDLLQKVPHHGLDLWLQVQIFYDHVDYTTQMAIDYAADGRLSKLRPEKAWETIEDLAQHKEEEEWNDLIFSERRSPDYIDATLKQELESMEVSSRF